MTDFVNFAPVNFTPVNFASDNTSCASDKIMQALMTANQGDAMPYGNDDWTAKVENKLKDVFECDLRAFPVATGTAANSLALACMTPPWGAAYCHRYSHVAIDECGAPEMFSGGAKLVILEGEQGKIDPNSLKDALGKSGQGDVHHVQPASLSITQLTEMGTAYSVSEIENLTEIARGYGLKVHMDGARFANALVGLDLSPAELTWRAGVDVLSFGASKNGAFAAESVVFFDKGLADTFELRRKRAGHLFSKMRFISAQMEAYLDQDHWLDNARAANAAAQKLEVALSAAEGVDLLYPVHGNQLFPYLKPERAEKLRGQNFKFYDWPWEGCPDASRQAYRLVCPFNTSDEEIDRFITALNAV